MTTQELKRLYRVALEMANQSPATRVKCGCALQTHDGNIITGNNHPVGESEEIVIAGHTVNYVHAEQDCIYQAAYNGVQTAGSVVLSLERPCQRCLMAMHMAGVMKVYYVRDYHSAAHGSEFCSEELMSKMKLERIDEESLT